MVEDDELRERVRALMREADINTVTVKQLKEQLEEEFKCNLKPKKKIIQEEAEAFMDTLEAPPDVAAEKGKRKRAEKNTPVTLSAEMKAFLAEHCDITDDEVHRPAVLKAVYKYIKDNELEDTGDEDGTIEVDDALMDVFEEPLTRKNLERQLDKHCKAAKTKAKPAAAEKGAKKARTSKASKGDEDGEPKAKGKGGFAAPLKLSPQLAGLLGVEAISRGEAMKMLWARIRENNLQDPKDKRNILFKNDPEFHEVIGVEKDAGFSMMKHLKNHFLGPA